METTFEGKGHDGCLHMVFRSAKGPFSDRIMFWRGAAQHRESELMNKELTCVDVVPPIGDNMTKVYSHRM